ncbi:MAG: ABC transporter permease, partial [Lachnospiraceae bacterium]|nr:ABC transporter permease [Lachnospiraceae bacterium]
EDKWADRVVCGIGTVTSCIPEFWLSLLLILVFSVWLGWLPSSGAYSVGMEGSLADRVRHLVLPLTVVVLGHLWYYAYLVRNRLLEETRADYVLLARMKGLSGKQVLYRHCLRNAMPSYLSMMAIALPHILGGTYVAETVFSYPGIGTLAYESARYQDYNLLMLISLMTGGLVIVGNMFAKVINERIDPRMGLKTGGMSEEVKD